MNQKHLAHWFRNFRQGDLFPYENYGIIATCRARLPGFKLTWNYKRDDGTGAANVVKGESTDVVHGVALCVSDEVLEALDVKEAYNKNAPANSKYLRIEETIEIDDAASSKTTADAMPESS